MSGSSDPIYWSKVFAWGSTAACVVFSARSASVFAKNAPRVFSILALLSLTWAILIPYYYQEQLPELLVGFTGFLFAYIGVLLRCEAHSPTTRRTRPFVVASAVTRVSRELPNRAFDNPDDGQAMALFLLPALVLPSTIPVISTFFPFPENITAFNSSILQPVVPTILLLVGYYQIGKGINAYSHSKVGKRLMIALLWIYVSADSAYTAFAVYCNLHPTSSHTVGPTFFQTAPAVPMTVEFLVGFGILKLLFCALFVPLVLGESLSVEDNDLSWKDKIKKWLGITIFRRAALAKSTATWTGIAGEYQDDGQVDLSHDKVELLQDGPKVSGEVYTPDLSARNWSVEGAHEKEILVLRYWPVEGASRGIGAIVLEYDSKSRVFRGCWLGYDRTKRQIGAGPYVLSADDNTAAVEKANAPWLRTPCYFPGSALPNSAPRANSDNTGGESP